MPQATVTYLFTVAATVIVGEDQVEGERSMEIMVYVPDPGDYIAGLNEGLLLLLSFFCIKHSYSSC